MVQHVLQKRILRPTSINHCWVDGYRISQDDEDERLRLFLLRTDIFQNAKLVIIILRHEFTFTQADWDAAINGCAEILPAYPWDTKYQNPKARRELPHINRVRSLLRAREMIDEVAALTWVGSGLPHCFGLSSYSSKELSHMNWLGVYFGQTLSVHGATKATCWI